VLAFLARLPAAARGLVIYTAFVNETGALTLGHFQQLLRPDAAARVVHEQPDVALASVFFASVIAIPLAYLTVRFEFRGALLIQTLGVLPLIMPPFVGAVALQLIFGRSGSVNLMLNDWFGFTSRSWTGWWA
jgi:iron(III) transport system permease protein